MLHALLAGHTSEEFCGALSFQKVSCLDSQRAERCVLRQTPSRLPLCVLTKKKQVFILIFCCLLLKCLFTFYTRFSFFGCVGEAKGCGSACLAVCPAVVLTEWGKNCGIKLFTDK